MPNRRDFLLGSAATAAAASLLPKALAQEAPPTRPEMVAMQEGYVGQYQGGVYLLPANDETVQWG
ncbi:twin-arginine translocation signal domain-containing protein [Microcoleus sp. FACHB-1515]|uniref:twin-arginine translocation signal domain-containing protein n=1 Tax=Cyanophyceae TaxID=3028117 RepID=UPI0018EF4A56|nr:twin-arginine translocation signal domain-containing protein [Microcoleus sp. FACHB-1515]